MSKLGRFVRFFGGYKYYIVVVLGVVLVGFGGQDSIMRHLKNQEHISSLKEEINEYNERYQKDQKQLRLLQKDSKAVEKIARERYFMKADDEDIFVLSSDLKTDKTYSQSNQNDTTENKNETAD